MQARSAAGCYDQEGESVLLLQARKTLLVTELMENGNLYNAIAKGRVTWKNRYGKVKENQVETLSRFAGLGVWCFAHMHRTAGQSGGREGSRMQKVDDRFCAKMGQQ